MKPGYFSRILSPLYYVTFFKPRQSHQHPFLLSLRTEIALFKPVSDGNPTETEGHLSTISTYQCIYQSKYFQSQWFGSQPMYPIEVGWLGETGWFCECHVIYFSHLIH